ncbi:MAG: hypothetical protein RLZZ599_447 [Bacteroidota bacterium]|jgi:hypothetical protein
MNSLKSSILVISFFLSAQLLQAQLLIPMDMSSQRDHLKAYGLMYSAIEQGYDCHWLLNYRGGAFSITDGDQNLIREAIRRGVSYESLSEGSLFSIMESLLSPAENTNTIALQKVPSIAVYSPPGAQPWDDAVTMVLDYAEIPFTTIYDKEVLGGGLSEFQWLHLHHEDFTGQYGKFYGSYRDAAWYINQKASFEAAAREMGYSKVSTQKSDVAKTISEYVENGGFLFAMCSATDSYDIALAARHTDICEHMFDGDPMAPGAALNLNYSATFAFDNFELFTNPLRYEYSNIDVTEQRVRSMKEQQDFFELFDFSAKYDVVPTILVQNHTDLVRGFYGQTTAYRPKTIKPSTTILGKNVVDGAARYIHGSYGKGFWTFYGGHDPEDYQHRVGDPATDLNNHPNSPGYRLILNNILFPAAKKPPQKT